MSGTQCRAAAIFNRAAAIFIEQYTIEFIPPQVTVRHLSATRHAFALILTSTSSSSAKPLSPQAIRATLTTAKW
jgi:hypothetical protein